MKVLSFILPAAFYLAFSGPVAATTEARKPFTGLVQVEEMSSQPVRFDVREVLTVEDDFAK